VNTDSARADAWVPQHLSGWPLAARRVAEQLVRRYGKPQEITAHALAWHGNGEWKRTVLHRTGVKHNFPLPHEDILEQTIDYRVPVDKLGDLAAYDGSLVVDHTRGELTAHCDSEQQNTLMLNLADDIVTGQRTVDEALGYHAQVVRGMQTHVPEAYPQKLKFKPKPSAQTADPGHEAELLEHLESGA
jgi:hypothetical protein